jgi:hypothetical protein
MTWFVHHDEKILGPFSTEKILADLKDGELSYGAFIWSKGQVEWIPISDWENNLEKILAHSGADHKEWKLRTPKDVKENLSFDNVVDQLKTMDNFQMVAVAPQDSPDWTPVYSSYAFMEALNLSRRNFLRAPLMGLAKVTRDGSRFSYVVKTATVGQGGLGVYGLGPNFEPGTHVSLKVESEDLETTITVNGTVVYNTSQGFVGLRFGELTAEGSAVIIEYMKRFQQASPKEQAEIEKQVKEAS